MRLMIRLAVAALLVCALAPLAFAQAAPPVASGLVTWQPLIVVGLGGIAYLLRTWTPNTGWLHGAGGHTLLVVGAGVLGGIGQAIADHGFSKSVIIVAAASAIAGFISPGNPSARADGMPPRASAQAGRASLVVLLVLAAIGFGGALAMAGCQTPGGQALKNCEMGQLPANEQAVLAEVGAVVMNPASVLGDLIELATKLGGAQVGCAVQAWDAFLASRQPSGSKMLAATAADQRTHALALTHAYLAGHPSTSCGPRRVAAAARALSDPPVCGLLAVLGRLGAL